MTEEEESTFSSLAEETEIDRCRDYVVTKAAFIRKRKKKRKKYLICIFLYDMLSFYRFYFFFLNQFEVSPGL